jgi:GH15 family glucan-1,4-alpha-glucosidase
VDAVRSELWVRTGVGGVARFEHDPLGAVGTAEIPGNPWIETTLWLAQHAVRSAKRAQDLDAARTILLWCAARAEGWGGLPEHLHPYRGETTAVAPAMAAHAWFVATVVDYVERLRHLRRCERCGAPAPVLREERALPRAEASLPGLVRNL